ncbi:hypothetical protein E3N88_35087 [Mikania micrantha]|uniref:Uncharacterized protein n=1 Tax=Mikania micrantha TaxID=192012 RepID=A0A5N6LZZ9_9ASTR|nr:hypothetical protein E3N88_35087 [Mikania micrantha]
MSYHHNGHTRCHEDHESILKAHHSVEEAGDDRRCQPSVVTGDPTNGSTTNQRWCGSEMRRRRTTGGVRTGDESQTHDGRRLRTTGDEVDVSAPGDESTTTVCLEGKKGRLQTTCGD